MDIDKESDKNVANDDDIKILKNWLHELDCLFEQTKINNTKERNALRNTLAEREQDKKRIKELEKDLYSANKIVEEYTDSIPVQKVKETVKEVIELIESEQFKIIMGDMTKVGRIKYLLKKLLEEK